MANAQQTQLHERDSQGIQDSSRSIEDATAANKPPPSTFRRHWKWWLMVALNILFLLVGQTVGTMLGRLYYDKGGNSKWMSTLIQSMGFPLLFIPFFLFPSPCSPSTTLLTHPYNISIALAYISIGIIGTGDNWMYSYGLLYLPVSTYSLICASQLAFNAIFAYFINSQKFTALTFNSVILLTFSAALLGVHSESENTTNGNYVLGFVVRVGASAIYSLLLSLMQLNFEKLIKRDTFSVVLEAAICTSFVASCASVTGLFASGEWRSIKGEYEGFETGKVSYVMTLAGIAVGWQVASVGILGLVFVVSSLFSNVISTLGLPMVPIFAVIFFHDSMDGVKVMAMLIAIWGFASYIYQHYLDDAKAKKVLTSDGREMSNLSSC